MLGTPEEHGRIAEGFDACEGRGTLLFDEIEKAHPRVLDVLLQLLDAARLTTGRNRVIDFSEWYVVLTSNIGAQRIMTMRKSKYETMERLVRQDAQRELRPEIFARITVTVVFNKLGYEAQCAIAGGMIAKECAALSARGFTITPEEQVSEVVILRDIRYNGLFDVKAEQVAEFHSALQCVIERGTYVSPTFAPHVKKPKNLTIDTLTAKEEMVLSIIGDGSDDALAAERLCLSPHTINTHRKTIMAKLGLHHKGQIMCYAVQKGYVRISADGVTRPGFQRVIQNLAPGKKGEPKALADVPK